jgi:hypothetical protein
MNSFRVPGFEFHVPSVMVQRLMAEFLSPQVRFLEITHETTDELAGLLGLPVKVCELWLINESGVQCHVKLHFTSPMEPLAFERNWMNSRLPSRSKPSAIFDIAETEARRI